MDKRAQVPTMSLRLVGQAARAISTPMGFSMARAVEDQHRLRRDQRVALVRDVGQLSRHLERVRRLTLEAVAVAALRCSDNLAARGEAGRWSSYGNVDT